MSKKISIITAVYNGEKYIEKSVNSMLSQTFQDFEYLIVDDGSTDSSLKKLQKINDSRIRIIKQNNQGQTNALIEGIKQAKGELIVRIDQDDYSLPNRLMRQVNFMDTHPNATVCGSRWQELHNNNLYPQNINFIQTNSDLKKIISRFNPFAHSAIIFRRDAYLKIGGYNKKYLIAMDYDLLVRLMEIGEAYNIEEVLTVIRMHNESSAMKNNRLKIMECIRVRSYAYLKFGGNPLITGFYFIKSFIGILLPRWLKNYISQAFY